MNTTMPLYSPLAPGTAYGKVYERRFKKARVTVALRPLSLPADWPYIDKWLYRQFAKRHSAAVHLPEMHLRETLSTMLQCDFAQPFVGLINGVPGFLIEICDGDKQCEGLEDGLYDFKSGEHAIRLVQSPTVINTRNWSAYALLSSLEYFLSHEQVKQIVWLLHEKDRRNLQLASQLQFKAGGGLQWSDIHVFLYTHEILMRFRDNLRPQIQKLP